MRILEVKEHILAFHMNYTEFFHGFSEHNRCHCHEGIEYNSNKSFTIFNIFL